MTRTATLTALLMLAAPPALAHPHIFIATGVEVLFDTQKQATGLRIRWDYDDFYSMIIIEDRQLDPDFDGALTPEEAALLNGFDMRWDEGFEGDTYALFAGQPLTLGPPQDPQTTYANGRLTTYHTRSFAAPLDLGQAELVIQAYDPTYYSAYRIEAAPDLSSGPKGCSATVFEPDPAAADAVLQAALAELEGQDGAAMDFPPVGAAFADEVRLTCPAQ
jgi:ABC-type uncharacterized transport system substrate-binding protein